MRLSISLFGRKDSIPRNDDISNNDDKMEEGSQTILNDTNTTTTPIPNNNNGNSNNDTNNNNNDTNSSENNNNKNTLTTRLGILSRFLPPAMTNFRNQVASNSNSPRSHVSRSRRGNSNATSTTTTDNNRNNANINNNKNININSNGISTRFINSSSSSTNSNCDNHPSTDASNGTYTNTNSNNITLEPRLLDVNCNITTFKRHRDSLEDSSDLDNTTTTTDNDAVTKRSSPRSSMSWRSSFPRSDSIPSVEDSGFSSSNGLSDDRDDVSINNASFDCDCEESQCSHRVVNNKRDSVNSMQHPFILCSVSARRRARTYSLDSTSSDLSDTNASSSSTISKTKSFCSSSTPSSRSSSSSSSSHEKHSSKLSSSLPTSCVHSSDNSDGDTSSDNDNNKERRRKSPSISEQSNKLSTTVVVAKRRSFRNKSRRNASSSSSSKSSSSNIGTPLIDTPSPATSVHSLVAHATDSHVQSEARRRSHNDVIDSNSDHNNNIDSGNNNDSDIFADTSSRKKKDLSSCVEAAMPFRFADLFRPHGLVTLVACILYTLLLMFVCGGLALAWTLLKKCVNKSDLKDLRSNMLESRRRREIAATPSFSTSDADDGTC